MGNTKSTVLERETKRCNIFLNEKISLKRYMSHAKAMTGRRCVVRGCAQGKIVKSFKRKPMLHHRKRLESYDLKTVLPHDSTFTLQQLSCSLYASTRV